MSTSHARLDPAVFGKDTDAFRRFMETAPDALVVIDIDGCIRAVNSQAVEMFGHPADDLFGDFVEVLVPERYRAPHPAHRHSFFDNPRTRPMGAGLDLTGVRADGSEFPVEISLSPMRLDTGLFVIAAIRDQTERRKMADMAARLAAIVESSDDAIIGKKLDGTITSWNRGAERLYGWKTHEVVGRSVSLIFPEHRGGELDETLAKVRAGRSVEHRETVRRRKDGSQAEVSLTVSPVHDANGELVGASTIARDITETKRAQRMFEALLESAPDAMVIVDRSGAIRLVNSQVERVFGHDREDLLGKPIEVLIPERYRPTHPAHRDGFFDEPRTRPMGVGLELQGLRADGTEFPVEVSLAPIETPDGTLVTAAVRDISSRLRIERSLRTREAQLAQAQAVAQVGSWEWDIPEDTVVWSDELYRIFGLNDERPPMTFESFLQLIHAGDRQRVERHVRGAYQSGRFPDFQHRIVRPDGEMRWIQARGIVQKDDEGKPVQMMGISMDITEEHQAEQRLRANLREKEVLLKEIHHRVKNNLQVIASMINLQSRTLSDQAAQEAFSESRDRIRTMALIHESLYQSKDLSSIDFAEYVRRLSGDLFRSYTTRPGAIQLESEIADLRLEVDTAVQCGLILNELVSNALKHAFPDDRTGAVHIRFQREDDHLVLEVADDGIGLPEDVDLKKTDSLGLKLVETLVHQLEAQMEVRSDHGTTFRIRIDERRANAPPPVGPKTGVSP